MRLWCVYAIGPRLHGFIGDVRTGTKDYTLGTGPRGCQSLLRAVFFNTRSVADKY